MNEHITNYLNYYIELSHAPEFAILLRGNWGCGKSFFVKKFIEKEGRDKFIYITLYGVKSTKEINDQIFEQLHPVLASKGMKITGKIINGILKGALKIDLTKDGHSELDISSNFKDFKLPEFLNNANTRILIFDDLERCSMDLPSIMGYINQFVETNENKVIIIANEEEIILSEEGRENFFSRNINGKFDDKMLHANFDTDSSNTIKYLKIKEKLIGKSFEIESNLDEALKEFIKELQTKNFIKLLIKNTQLIKSLYSNAGYNNLRHLKQSILDLERLYLLLPDFALQKDSFLIDLLSYFLAMSFELKKGKFKEEDIKQLFYSSNHTILPNDKNTLFEILKQKYSLNYGFPLNVPLWFEFFSKGTIISKVELEQSIKSSAYFYDENTPAYVKLWRWLQLNDDEFTSLYKTVYRSFEKSQIENQDLLLHITSMLLYYSEIGLIRNKKATIISIAKRNVANLKIKHLLSFIEERDIPAFGSMGYHGNDIKEFEEFKEFLKKEARGSIVNNYPKLAVELFSLMKNSPEEFRQKISLNNTSDSKYYNVPIFNHIEVKKFVRFFLQLGNDEKGVVGSILKDRYRIPEFAKDLIEELEWLKEVKEELIKEKEKRKKKISGFRLSGIIDNDLIPSIETLKKVLNGQGNLISN